MNDFSLLLSMICISSVLIQAQCDNNQALLNGSTNMSFSNFGVSYGKVFPHEAQGYRVLILESELYSNEEIASFKEQGIHLFAYLSLGEVNESRWYFEELAELGLLGKNEIWGSYFIDVNNDKVKSLFIKVVVPKIRKKGFDGLFLDTIDAVAPYTNRSNYKAGMVQLINEIKVQFPELVLIQNGGDFLIDEVHQSINAYAKEDVASAYDFTNSQYLLETDQGFTQSLSDLKMISSEYNLPVLIIDFADSDSLKSAISTRLDTTGYDYFISTIELNTLPAPNNTNR